MRTVMNTEEIAKLTAPAAPPRRDPELAVREHPLARRYK
jgi:hypothetical protein